MSTKIIRFEWYNVFMKISFAKKMTALCIKENYLVILIIMFGDFNKIVCQKQMAYFSN